MNRREPGYLVPEQRRCEHVWSLALRNLRSSGQGLRGVPPCTYFTLSIGHTVAYRSEAAECTANPTWVPMEWQYLRLDPGEAALLKAPLIRVEVFITSAGAGGGVAGRLDLKTPAYFPAPGWRADSDELVLEAAVDLRELQFLAFDLIDVLSELRPAGEGGGGRGKDPKDDVADLPPDAVGFQLDTLPQNLLIFWLDDGHYTTPETYRLLKPGGGTEAGKPGGMLGGATDVGNSSGLQSGGSGGSSSGGSSSSSKAAKLDLRRAFDAANRLLQLRRDTVAARAATETTLQELRWERSATDGLAASTDAVAAQPDAAALVQRARRVHELRGVLASLADSVVAAESATHATRALLAQRAAATRAATQRLRSLELLLPVMHAELEDARSEVSLVRNLLSAKQLSLLSELRALYPIVEIERGRRYTIRGIALPDCELNSLPEEQVSTALGYTCHLVLLASKYLAVPLRYTPCHMASRSTMRDDVVLQTRDFPLYWKGATQEEFAVAVHLLQRDIRQLLHSQGVAVTESHMLASLSRLFSLLLDVPLPTETG